MSGSSFDQTLGAPRGGAARTERQRQVRPVRGAAGGRRRAAAASRRCPNRSMSTELRIGQCSFMDESWTLIDAPGRSSSRMTPPGPPALPISRSSSASRPRRAATVGPVLRMLEGEGIPQCCSSTRSTRWPARCARRRRLAGLLVRALVLRQVPIRDGEAVAGYVDLVSERAYRYRRGQPSELVRLPDEIAAREREARTALIESWPITMTRCSKRCWRTRRRVRPNSTRNSMRIWPRTG